MKTSFSPNPKAVVMLAVFFTSFSAILIRLSNAPSLTIAAYRMGFSVLLVTPLLIRERRRPERGPSEPAGSERAQPRRVSDLLLCVLSGVFLALHFGTWIEAVKHTTVASATVLVNTHPIFVVAAGYLFLGERLHRRSLLFVVGALAGTALLSYGDFALGGEALQGDVLAVLGAVTVSGYMLIGRIVRQRVSATKYVVVVYSVSAVLLIAANLVTGTPLWPYPLRELALFFGLAFFCTLLGHTLFNWALEHLKTSFVSMGILSEPVYATLMAVGIFGETPPAAVIAGGAVVLVSLLGFVRNEARVEAALMATTNQFDEKAARWNSDGHKNRNDAVAEAVRAHVPLTKDTRVLDFGAGTGLLSERLSPYVRSVVAVDTSQGMIDELRARLGDAANITARKHDLIAEPLDDQTFDLIVSSMTMHHVKDVATLLRRFHDHLAPDGYVALADLEPEDGSFHGGNTSVHHHGFDPSKLAARASEAGFRDAAWRRIYTIQRDRGQGTSHFHVFLLTAHT